MSRIDMNMPSTIAKNAMSMRGSIFSDAGAAGPASDPAGAATVAVAISVTPNLLVRRRTVRRRGARIDVDDDAETGTQAATVERVLGERDTNGNALDHL